jgi:hypothetical protein
MKQISSDMILMSKLMINNKSTKYITNYRLTQINKFDYLELRLIYNNTSLINIKPIQLITPIQHNDNIDFID